MMDWELPSTYLEAQHRDIDRGIQTILGGGGDMAALTESLRLLHWHLYLEEELLFPVVQADGITMPIFVMKREHGMMWPLLEELLQACADGQSADAVRASCDELFKQLQIHNPKEEQIVYSAADNVMKKGSGESLRAALEAADPQDADGWVCEKAR